MDVTAAASAHMRGRDRSCYAASASLIYSSTVSRMRNPIESWGAYEISGVRKEISKLL